MPRWPQYDVARDGRFLINTDLQDTSTEPIHLLLNRHPPVKQKAVSLLFRSYDERV